jgi:hypothetical protein
MNSEVVQGRILQSEVTADQSTESLPKKVMLAIYFPKGFFHS